MIGDLRYVHFLTYVNLLLHLGEAKVEKNGPLTVSTGVPEVFRIKGIDASGHIVALKHALRVRPLSRHVRFEQREREFQRASGHVSNLFEDGINLPPRSASGLPFCVDFPFSHFISNTPGAKPDFAAQGITWMNMVLLRGPVGANNFAITKIETLDSGAAAASPCAYVASNH
jgi:hypothetical protein